MIREDRFLISQRPYAADLNSLRLTEDEGCNGTYWRGRIDAVWFRRRNRITVACIGSLWDSQDDKPADGNTFLTAHTDGRYGGNCNGHWNGTSYWGNGTLHEQEQHLAILRPMLDTYPAIPDGYDGWWRF